MNKKLVKIGGVATALTLAVAALSPAASKAETKTTTKELKIVETRDCPDAVLKGDRLTLTRYGTYQDLSVFVVGRENNERYGAGNVTFEAKFDANDPDDAIFSVRQYKTTDGVDHLLVRASGIVNGRAESTLTIRSGILEKNITVCCEGYPDTAFFENGIQMEAEGVTARFTDSYPFYVLSERDNHYAGEKLILLDRYEASTVDGPVTICTYQIERGTADVSELHLTTEDGKDKKVVVRWH